MHGDLNLSELLDDDDSDDRLSNCSVMKKSLGFNEVTLGNFTLYRVGDKNA